MRKDEAKFHTKMMKWLQYNIEKFPVSFKLETKVARLNKKLFPYSELTEKEERLLLKAKHSFCLQTNSDEARRGTPCDGDCISGGGIIFIQWTRWGNKEFHCIDIDDFIKHRDNSDTKSLTEIEARDIAFITAKHV